MQQGVQGGLQGGRKRGSIISGLQGGDRQGLLANNGFLSYTDPASLKGNQKGLWSITVSSNWRLTFEYFEGNVYILNYEDYH